MENEQKKCELAVVVLAAGAGKRMRAAHPDKPKALVSVGGIPFIVRLLKTVTDSAVADRLIFVVGHLAEAIKNELGDSYEYAEQSERLGTGHAVMMTENLLKNSCANVMALYSDHPFVKPETLKRLKNEHLKNDAAITMLTAAPEDFNGWRAAFADFGRIIRNEKGEVVKLVEKKDATPDELAIREVNLGMYVFRGDWLWPHLAKLETNNAQKEYYLTDLIKMATTEGAGVMALSCDPREGIGMNTPEQVAEAEKLLEGFSG